MKLELKYVNCLNMKLNNTSSETYSDEQSLLIIANEIDISYK